MVHGQGISQFRQTILTIWRFLSRHQSLSSGPAVQLRDDRLPIILISIWILDNLVVSLDRHSLPLSLNISTARSVIALMCHHTLGVLAFMDLLTLPKV